MATRTVRGTLTTEGVECQALRATSGQLYTLIGDLRGFKAGDRVIVVGTDVEISFCMQGTTLSIVSIAADCGRAAVNLQGGGEVPSPFVTSAPQQHFGRGTYACLRVADFILLHAEGSLPNWNSQAELVQMPWRIWPPQFGLYFQDQQISLPALRPFAISALFGFPRTATTVVVHDADGTRNVAILELPATHTLMQATNADSATVRTGYSPVSLQAAFDAAVAQLPASAPGPDRFVSYTVKHQGLHAGGFAGLHLYFAQVEAIAVPEGASA